MQVPVEKGFTAHHDKAVNPMHMIQEVIGIVNQLFDVKISRLRIKRNQIPAVLTAQVAAGGNRQFDMRYFQSMTYRAYEFYSHGRRQENKPCCILLPGGHPVDAVFKVYTFIVPSSQRRM